MFFPLENTWAPFIWVFTRVTQRRTYSRSSSWLCSSLLGRGAIKYRQIRGASVTLGWGLVGILDRFTMSKWRSRNRSHVSFALLSS